MEIEIQIDEGTKIELPSGKIAFYKPCLGLHIVKASTLTNGDPGLFTAALMWQLVTIPGTPMVMEDFLQLPGKDYMTLTKIVTDDMGDFT
jgi:hypothetical protein